MIACVAFDANVFYTYLISIFGDISLIPSPNCYVTLFMLYDEAVVNCIVCIVDYRLWRGEWRHPNTSVAAQIEYPAVTE